MDDPEIVNEKPKHYYGDIVRDLFLLAAVIMLVGLPWFIQYLTVPTPISIIGMVVLVLAAGATNPVLRWTAYVNVSLSVIGFVVFESYAVRAFVEFSPSSKFFAANQLLALVFALAVYYSAKTLRGFLIDHQSIR